VSKSEEELKKDKEGYINDVCKAIEESRKTNKYREVYETRLFGKSQENSPARQA